MKITISSDPTVIEGQGGMTTSIPAAEIELPSGWVKVITTAAMRHGVLPTEVICRLLARSMPTKTVRGVRDVVVGANAIDKDVEALTHG